ncbi:serine/threonine-protein kinase TNNI3K-like isoform X2 [Oratosquilla oratoria]|uniref:serine/threonine-protein kinase TNNI3K-like isoform X2 n=1 Tax=Oratosquilla oratoria TaxID=337810 RepID=UPI003F76BD30
MGNYKTRPKITCSQELRHKIMRSYLMLNEKISEDLRLDISELTEIQQACCSANVDKISSLLSAETLGERTETGLTLLHLGCLSKPEKLYDKDAKESRIDDREDADGHKSSKSPGVLQLVKFKESEEGKSRYVIHECCDRERMRDTKPHIRLLLQRGADPAIISKNGFSPLHLASFKGDVEIVRLFLENCSHLDHTGAGSVTALHISCMAGHLEVTQALAQRGANIEARDAVSFSPLHIASFFGHDAVVEYLLSRGVDVNIAGTVGDRPIHLAASKGYFHIVKMLLNKGARAKVQDEEGNTPLHHCVLKGSVDILNLLLQPHHKADVYMQNIYMDTPLHIACYGGHYECCKIILTYGGSSLLLKENLWGETPLHAACTSGASIELVQFLLNQDATFINYQSPDGHTPLHSACYHGHFRIVQLLVNHGADINIPAREFSTSDKKDDQTPLMWAYDRGYDDIINLLKHLRRPGMHDDYARGEYLSGLETSYFPVPSPIGKLRTMIQDKADVLHLRSVLPPHLHLSLAEIENIETIGSGSFGKVFKGKYDDKIVAVKRYRANVFYGKSDIEMFCREVSILGSLDSPYIVKFLGACLHDPSQFAIVTEYVSGGSLFSTLHEQKRSLDTVTKFEIALDVAKGMYYLHTLPQPIIHRDLNSHNILLNEGCHAMVADFGESRLVQNIFEENMTKQPGNLRWMAPEVFTQCTRYSIKADIFSYALCLWELLTSELPFSHLKPAAAAADMAYKHSRPPLEMAYPVEISAILERSWHKIPEERPNFAQIITELEEIKNNQNLAVLDNNSCLHHHRYSRACSSGPSTGTISPSDPNMSADPNSNSELSGHVTALRTRWEQEAIRGQTAFKSCPPSIEELRSRMNNNGYVEGNTYQYRIAPVINKHRKSMLQNF